MYRRLPDQVPMNWGLDGEVSYGSRANLWWLAGISPLIALLFTALPKIDPRKKNYSKFKTYFDGFCVVMMIFMLGMVTLVISESLNPGMLSVSVVVVAACGLLFIFIGNMLPKVKNNFFVGVRTPWTLSDAEVWNKTHRLAGFLFFFGGIAIVALAFLLSELALFIAMMVIVGIAAIIPIVMSYIWYRKLGGKE